MRIHLLLILAGTLVLGATSCKKEFYPGDTVEEVDTVTAANATTLSFIHGWGGELTIVDDGSPWRLDDTLGGLRIPLALQAGDRLIATLQVGLQQTGVNSPCLDSVHVSIGVVLGNSFTVTPDSAGVVPFDGAFTMDSLWKHVELMKQFTRQQELIVGSDMSGAVVQSFARLRFMQDGCISDTIPCYITNRSLTLTVLHP